VTIELLVRGPPAIDVTARISKTERIPSASVHPGLSNFLVTVICKPALPKNGVEVKVFMMHVSEDSITSTHRHVHEAGVGTIDSSKIPKQANLFSPHIGHSRILFPRTRLLQK